MSRINSYSNNGKRQAQEKSSWKMIIGLVAGVFISTVSSGQVKTTNIEHTQKDNLQFIENKGQWDAQAKYKADLNGGTVFLSNTGFVYDYFNQAQFNDITERWHDGEKITNPNLSHHAYKVNFVNANPDIRYVASSKFPNYNNYFIGNDNTKWAGKVGIFGRVDMENVYDGIDLTAYGIGRDFKYDFKVSPGANPALIQLVYEGVQPVLTKEGHLLIKTSVNEFKELAPYTYQMVNGRQREIASAYIVSGNQVSFRISEEYDHTLPLIIDPQLKFATYSGATTGAFLSLGTTYDVAGSLYAAAGAVFSNTPGGWPTTVGAYQTTPVGGSGSQYGVINKYSPDGSTLVYSTYIGAQNSVLVFINAMSVTPQNELVITGSVRGNGYPVTAGAFDQTLDGTTDIFVTKFKPDGSGILQSTYVGGTGNEAGIASELLNPTNVVYAPQANTSGGSYLNAVDMQIDNNGNIWIASNSTSTNFPVTANAFQTTNHGGSSDGVIFCLNPTLNTLLYSTYYGGAGLDNPEGITIMANGNIAVSGLTTSTALPTTANAFHPTFLGGTSDGFACVVNPVTGAMVASTYLGTSTQDNASKIQANINNEIYILGRTNGNYPVTAGVYNIANGMLFVQKLNSTLTTSLAATRTGFPPVGGGNTGCNPSAFLVDSCGTVYLSCIGLATSTPAVFPILPITPNALVSTPRNFWCATLSGDLATLKYASYFGSTATAAAAMDHQHQGTNHFDPKGILYQSICSRVNNNLGTPGSWSPTMLNTAGTSPNDPFSFKIDFQFFVYSDFSVDPTSNNGRDTGCAPLTLSFFNNSSDSVSYVWDFGDGSPVSNLANPTHVFQAGIYDVKLIAISNSPTLCRNSDTAILHIVSIQRSKPGISLKDTIVCSNDPVSISATTNNTTTRTTYQWSPASAVLSGNGSPNVLIDPTVNGGNITLIAANGTGECDSASQATMHIAISDIVNARVEPADTSICPGDTILLKAFGGNNYVWSPDYNISALNQSSASVWPLEDLDYQILITDTNNCQANVKANVNVRANLDLDAGKDIDIKYGEATLLDGKAPGSFFWEYNVYPPNVLRPEVKPSQTTTYYLTGKTGMGCMVTDSVTVYVTFTQMPNAFSPNGDGLNDVFQLMPNNTHFQLMNFSIYDRWGNRVFYTEDVKEGWDGTYKDKAADMGVYYYYVAYAIGTKNYTLKGDLSLIR